MASRAPITGAPTRAPLSNSNVHPIRRGVAIPEQRAQDQDCIVQANLAAAFTRQAYKHAQTEPNSEKHLFALHMASISDKLPCNNLRLLVTPPTPRSEWFEEAWKRWRVASAANDLATSQWQLAWHLDFQDGGDRRKAAQAQMDQAGAALRQALEDALRTPTTRRCDAARKQEMLGRRAWAIVYRPEWQAVVDEDLARYPVRKRKPRTVEGGK